ncbi:MAG: dihydrodipicolinate synthetase [Saprospiraceae bacterium]|nr:dihydrodipicolinate synthetase [Saprospiraceae bacterium]
MDDLPELIAAPFTPFNSEGKINLKMLDQLAEFYELNGVTGAFIIGTTGECSSLTHLEKKAMIENWGKAKRNLRLVSMVGGTCLAEMKELAQCAAQFNSDAISILCPYYFKLRNEEELVEYCVQVSEAAPELPLYYYHIPSMTGGNYSMAKFLELADQSLPALAGIKFSSSDILDFQICKAFKNGKYEMLWGTDEALLSGLVAGADGAVGSTYNYAAPLYRSLMTDYTRGDLPSAQKKQNQAVDMVNILMKYGGARAGKGFMKSIGIDCGDNRLPIKSMDHEELQAMQIELTNIGFFDFASKSR